MVSFACQWMFCINFLERVCFLKWSISFFFGQSCKLTQVLVRTENNIGWVRLTGIVIPFWSVSEGIINKCVFTVNLNWWYQGPSWWKRGIPVLLWAHFEHPRLRHSEKHPWTFAPTSCSPILLTPQLVCWPGTDLAPGLVTWSHCAPIRGSWAKRSVTEACQACTEDPQPLPPPPTQPCVASPCTLYNWHTFIYPPPNF